MVFSNLLPNIRAQNKDVGTRSAFPYYIMEFKCVDLLTMMCKSNDFKITFVC